MQSEFDDVLKMTEADVREEIVRPLLTRLGYRRGTEANIKTEIHLKYDRVQLGRKNPKKDPPLQGRADYICDVIAFGRWVVEVKAPREELTTDVVQQAQTYAAHPDVGAIYFLVTNGLAFQLYRTGELGNPTLSWLLKDEEKVWLRILNTLSPDAIRDRARTLASDSGEPLGVGLASRLRIIGGRVSYEDHEGDNPFVDPNLINGLVLPVTGGFVERATDGRIHGHIELAKVAAFVPSIGNAMGITEEYDFYSSDPHLSTDPDKPTILQNFVSGLTPQGKIISLPVIGAIPFPLEIGFVSYTTAVGFADGQTFVGTIELTYDFTFSKLSPMMRPSLEVMVGRIPATAKMRGSGRFEVQLINDRLK